MFPITANRFHQLTAIHLKDKRKTLPRDLFLLPDEKRSKTEILGTVGAGLNMMTGMALVCSPLIVKTAKRLPVGDAKSVLSMLIPRSWLKRFSEQKNVENILWRMGSVFSLITGVVNYHTAINTRQPSLLLNNILGYLNGIGLLIWPESLTLKAGIFISWCFLSMGKQNDIDNSNHPERRREWDIHQLIRPLKKDTHSWPQFQKKLVEFAGFVRQDFRNTFSLGVWKDCLNNYDKKSSWQVPQSYFTAMAGQMFAVGFISTVLSNRFRIKNISPVLIPFAGIIFNLPIMLRAWQNRHEPESKAMLAAWPVGIIGDAFRVSKTRNHLTGLSSSGYVATIGLEMNSKRYGQLLDYLNFYYHLAKKNPMLQARDIASALTQQPENLKHLEKQIGKSRALFLLNLLKDAQKAGESGIPLAQYLRPMLSSAPITKKNGSIG